MKSEGEKRREEKRGWMGRRAGEVMRNKGRRRVEKRGREVREAGETGRENRERRDQVKREIGRDGESEEG